ncbi:MAG: ComEC/Rec2 family competence protein [bacterium]|nr:ComEC/Rec2 family competence protein [bacterium]
MMMRPDNLFFFAACGFVSGAILGGLGAPPIAALLILVGLVLATLLWKIPPIIILTVAAPFLLGNTYYAVDDYAYQSALQGVERVTRFEGVVIDEPRRSLTAQIAKVELVDADVQRASGGRIYVRADLYPELSYGDVVRVSGTVVPPPLDSYGDYMAKEHIHGTAFYPEVEVIGNKGSPFFAALFGVRQSLKEHISRLFSQPHAAFLSGILIGDKDEFSPEFLQKLSISGTMHLMALSGLNMTIIVFIALGIFSVVFLGRKRPQFIATFGTVGLFVAMTGFQVSALRAALMAFLVGLAGVTQRLYSPHNAIAFAALVITLWNPKAPVFDLGFQLSFLATLAIIYFAPVLKLLPPLRRAGTLGWRDALAITAAAQLGVAPLTIIAFGNFSFTALIANIGILAVIPLLTVMGFLSAFFSMIFPPLAHLISVPIAFLIDYVIAVVETFSVVYVPFNPHVGIATAALYYSAVLWLCWRFSPALRPHEASS